MRSLSRPVLDLQRIDLELVTPLVQTPGFVEATGVAGAVVRRNEIVVIDGPPGTGKTTAARHVANECGRPCAVVTIPGRVAPLDLLRLIHLGVTGAQHHGTRYQMTTDLLRVLTAWGGVLVIDETHNSGVDGLKTIVHLYEGTGRRFAVVLVGSGVSGVVSQYRNLSTRVLATVHVKPLGGPPLMAAIKAMDARLAATPDHVLSRHNQRTCGGNLRRWVKTITWLDIYQTGGGPVDPALLDDITSLLKDAS